MVSGIFALADRVNATPTITEVWKHFTPSSMPHPPLPPSLPQAQATKFGNFLVTSKYTSSLTDAVHLLTAARALSNNKVSPARGTYVIPACITQGVRGGVYIFVSLLSSLLQYVVPTAVTLPNSLPISSSNPDLAVQLTTLMGGVVEGFTPKVKSLEDPEGEVNPRTRTMTAGKDKYVVQ